MRKPIPNCTGYEIDFTGRVFSIDRPVRCGERIIQRRGKELGRHVNGAGYYTVSLHVGDEQKTLCVHRLMAATFMGPRPEGFVIDHINRIKTDNRIENLRIVPRPANTLNSGPRRDTRDHKGVHERAPGKYRAYLTINRKRVYLGTFERLEDAIAARNTAEARRMDELLSAAL